MNKSKNSKPAKLGKNDYCDQLAPRQLDLNDVARCLQHTGKRLVVLIEGRDTVGKGGVITAMSETLNRTAGVRHDLGDFEDSSNCF